MVDQLRNQLQRIPGWGWSSGIVVLVALIAAISRLVGLASEATGFREIEATNGLFAGQIGSGHWPIFFGGGVDASEPFFPYLIRVTTGALGRDVAGTRLAAAICGILVAIGCALWYQRALGRWWGLAGGLLVATSAWQLLFSRQADAAISGAVFSTFGLWALWRALDDRERRFPIWYPISGILFGLGFYTDVNYLLVPALVVLSAVYLLLVAPRDHPHYDRRNPLLLVGSMALTMVPLAGFYLDNPEALRRNIDLAGGIPNRLGSGGDDFLTLLGNLIWAGPDNPALNLPGSPLFSAIIVVWGLIGIAVALRWPLRPVHGIALLWPLPLMMFVALLDTNNPALLLPLTPILFLLPLIGMRAVFDLLKTHQRWAPLIAAGVIVLSVLGSSGWALYDYFGQWYGSDATYFAMRGDVRDTTSAIGDLPDDGNPVYIMDGGAERIVRYLAPARIRRDIDSPSVLPIPADGDSYLLYPRSIKPDPALEAYFDARALVATGESPSGETSYWVRMLDPRIRTRLPYALPVLRYPNGWRLPGFDLQPVIGTSAEEPKVDVVLLWRAPPDADQHTVEVRLRPPGEQGLDFVESATLPVRPWKNNQLDYSEFLLVHLRLDFPRVADLTADLQVALHKPDGAFVEPSGVDFLVQDEVYAFLNTISFLPADRP